MIRREVVDGAGGDVDRVFIATAPADGTLVAPDVLAALVVAVCGACGQPLTDTAVWSRGYPLHPSCLPRPVDRTAAERERLRVERDRLCAAVSALAAVAEGAVADPSMDRGYVLRRLGERAREALRGVGDGWQAREHRIREVEQEVDAKAAELGEALAERDREESRADRLRVERDALSLALRCIHAAAGEAQALASQVTGDTPLNALVTVIETAVKDAAGGCAR